MEVYVNHFKSNISLYISVIVITLLHAHLCIMPNLPIQFHQNFLNSFEGLALTLQEIRRRQQIWCCLQTPKLVCRGLWEGGVYTKWNCSTESKSYSREQEIMHDSDWGYSRELEKMCDSESIFFREQEIMCVRDCDFYGEQEIMCDWDWGYYLEQEKICDWDSNFQREQEQMCNWDWGYSREQENWDSNLNQEIMYECDWGNSWE